MGLDRLHQHYVEKDKPSSWFCSIHPLAFLCKRNDNNNGSNPKTYCPVCFRSWTRRIMGKSIDDEEGPLPL